MRGWPHMAEVDAVVIGVLDSYRELPQSAAPTHSMEKKATSEQTVSSVICAVFPVLGP